jgi:hypothetical protein
VPTNGISAIDVAQPPSASADSKSAAAATALMCRSIAMPDGSPHLSRWYEPCSGKTSNSSNRAQAFKPLSPETINAEQLSRALGPQYVGSKKSYRSAIDAMQKINP